MNPLGLQNHSEKVCSLRALQEMDTGTPEKAGWERRMRRGCAFCKGAA